MDSDKLYNDMMESIRQVRDNKRPHIDDVVMVMDRLFNKVKEHSPQADYRAALRGPLTWSWLDATNIDAGFEKWFVVSFSTMSGTEGYPLLTVRQSAAPRLDAWVTVSQLVVGPSQAEIETSVAMALANHKGAFDGVREAVEAIVDIISDGAGAESLIKGMHMHTKDEDTN